jgi:hypothetical protein
MSFEIEGKLRKVCREMLQYLNNVRVVSRLELFMKARESLEKVRLSDDETGTIIRQYDLRPDQLVVISIIGDTPYMMGCPFLHEEITYKSKVFYHSHTYQAGEGDLEYALMRLRNIRLRETGRIVENIFSKAGYQKVSEDKNTGMRKYSKDEGIQSLNCIVLESVSDAPHLLDKIPKSTVLGVPAEDTPAPFTSFYRNYKNKVIERNLSIVVVDVENLKVSPFIGYPSDKGLLSQFSEPDLAARISTVWGEGEEESN